MFLRRLVQRSLVPGEPSVDRVRKQLVVPLYCVLGALAAFWFLLLLPGFVGIRGNSKKDQAATIISRASAVIFAVALLPAGVYVVRTKRISRSVCEYPVLACAAGILIVDFGFWLNQFPSVAVLNILALDSLLLCKGRVGVTLSIVVATTVWYLIRGVLEMESAVCSEPPNRFSFLYFSYLATGFLLRALVPIVDFMFTRGFADSMNEQKAMVEASIKVSEIAACSLSRYETDSTQRLLEGPDGEQLPSGLRQALLQLVQNLAMYRPYLPQSCLPDDGEEEEALDEPTIDRSTSELQAAVASASAGSAVEVLGSVAQVDRRQSGSGSIGRRLSAGQLSRSSNNREERKARVTVAAEVRSRRVSMIAVNSSGFLENVKSAVAVVTAFVNNEIETFAGEVAGERGVVDIVSGDHMFANFNAARLCTTHRVSAARVVWGMTRKKTAQARRSVVVEPLRRTACVCTGTATCGDYGTTDMRRFMILGGVYSTLLCLERVAAQCDLVLADDGICGDADVASNFFSVLVEQLTFEKRGPRPFLLWRLAGRRQVRDGPEEWMYELDRQEPDPYAEWNKKVRAWLVSGVRMSDEHVADSPCVDAKFFTGTREDSRLVEATIVGSSVACGPVREPYSTQQI